MSGPFLRTVLLLSGLTSLLGTSTPTETLTFKDRVRAQEAIERVYYSHRIGAPEPFENAITQGTIEKKVRTYLEQSLALESFWGVPVTADALERELLRIAQNTQLPERLTEVFTALGNDPILIQECLARPVLVDRLARSYFASDQRIHQSTRIKAEALRAEILDDPSDSTQMENTPEIVEVLKTDDAVMTETPTIHPQVGRLLLEASQFRELRTLAPQSVGVVGPLLEQPEGYVFRRILEESEDRFRLATYSVPKVAWDVWWNGVEARWADRDVLTIARADMRLPLLAPPSPENSTIPAIQLASGATCALDASWVNGVLDDAPEGRSAHTAVWTGTEMIVWGGHYVAGETVNTGGRYDPITDTWKAMSRVNAPIDRHYHTAIWTGSMMVVWGGFGPEPNGGVWLNSGGRYDPGTDSWSATSLANAPAPRGFHTGEWTGSVMVIWGGTNGPNKLASGGRYDPETDTWAPTSMLNAPSVRAGHSSVWTGQRMIIWGGLDLDFLNSGARYDPSNDSWSALPTAASPVARAFHSATWTGSQMIVWGGISAGSTLYYAGGLYSPSSNSWTALDVIGAPSLRWDHKAVWTGTEMLIYGGRTLSGYLNSGGRYNPSAKTWTLTTEVNAPSRRATPSVVWTDTLMIVWGGDGLATGGRYSPSTDSWTPTSITDSPSPRSGHAAFWTGSEMIIWGGSNNGSATNTGGRYDPTIDAWRAITTVGAPAARIAPVVWTGTRLFVWGGTVGGTVLDTGGVYDPASDSWTATSPTNAPSPRTYHSVLWTGSEVIIWGGDTGASQYLSTGARFDPARNTWSPMTMSGAPSPRRGHVAFWTGTQMLVWGGSPATYYAYYLNTGGRYDPSTDTWHSISLTNAPIGRAGSASVWTGREMVVWGGFIGSTSLTFFGDGGRYDPETDTWRATSMVNAPEPRASPSRLWTGSNLLVWGGFGATPATFFTSGGRYDPLADSWMPMSTAGAPGPRQLQTAVWTGSLMIIWGGASALANPTYYDTGGAYDPASDTWIATSMANAPSRRAYHSAIWTGRTMLVWGGTRNFALGNGGGLSQDPISDCDADGVAIGSDDCDDSHPAVYPGAPQVCGDGLNNDCDFSTWPSLAGTNEVDDDGDGFSECQDDCDDANAAIHSDTVEICDGSDNNCDGQADEGNPTDGAACDTGLKGICANGRFDCQNGPALCVSELQPSTERCDDLDNDCNGLVDDGNPDSGAGCVTGLPGVCSAGTMICRSGSVACVEDLHSSIETCDELDNDCDGVVDDFATSCGVGVCTSTGFCSSGMDTCTQGSPASEACDHLDNNCDGAVDNVTGSDDDLDGIDNACDNCQHAANTSQQDADQDGQGDGCDFTVIDPLPGATFDCRPGAFPPTISWSPYVYDRFRVYIGRNPSFTSKITSGKSFLMTTSWTVPKTNWTKLCKGTGTALYIKIQGVDLDAPNSSPNRKAFSDVIIVSIQR